MRRVVIDVADLAKGRERRVRTLKANPAEQAIARQMAEREREEKREPVEAWNELDDGTA